MVLNGRSPLRWMALCALFHLAVVLTFMKGFLLTRVELPDASSNYYTESLTAVKKYNKLVLLIVDAVRYDFVCESATRAKPFAGAFPRTVAKVEAAGGAAALLRFVADTPTITMSRLKALITGGLPTFLDVGKSFSASTVTEDNLIQQLKRLKKRVVFMGDDTWEQLVPGAFAESYPYPSFNVKDLHTVDDGVWEHLVPLLGRPDTWDVLVAHYLGVDHAGHSHGVNSPQMKKKLSQMDDQVAEVIDTLLEGAGPGGPHEDTLLLVISDHGQTLGGDHGGGSSDEVDSILLAASLRKMHRALHTPPAEGAGELSLPYSFDAAMFQHLRPSTGKSGSEAGETNNSSSSSMSSVGGRSAAASSACPADSSSKAHLCTSSMPQIDFTATVAHLLGVPLPFGNLGKVPPLLWAVLAETREGGGGAGGVDVAGGENPGGMSLLESYATALDLNSQQVHQYLNRYSEVSRLPRRHLADAEELYAAAQSRAEAWRARALQPQAAVGDEKQQQEKVEERVGRSGQGEEERGSLLELVQAQLAYLEAAAALAREKFTCFQQLPIWLGCVLAVALLGFEVWATWSSCKMSPEACVCACLSAVHALALFSVGALMGEGRLQCLLVGAMTLLLLKSAVRAVLASGKAPEGAGRPPACPAQQAAVDTQTTAKMGKGMGCTGKDFDAGAGAGAGAAVSAAAGEGRGPAAPAATAVGSTSGLGLAGGSLQQPVGKAGCDDTRDSNNTYKLRAGVNGEGASAVIPGRLQVVQAVLAAVVMLAVNVLLQWVGLIDRYGQDPHDKTEPSWELLLNSSPRGAAAQQARELGFAVGPLGGLGLLWWWADGWLGKQQEEQQLQQGPAGSNHEQASLLTDSSRGSSSYVQGLLFLLGKWTVGLQLLAIAAFWGAQLTGTGGYTAAEGVAWLLQQLPCWQAGLPATAAGPAAGIMGGSVNGEYARHLLGGVLGLPLRLLLPRAVYISALALLCAAAAAMVGRLLQQACRKGFLAEARKGRQLGREEGECLEKRQRQVSPGRGCADLRQNGVGVWNGVETAGGMEAEGLRQWGTARMWLWQVAGLSGPVAMGLGYKGPMLLLLAVVQGIALLALVRLQGVGCRQYRGQQGGQVPGRMGRSPQLTAAPGVWSMFALQLFFCSGHFCEFSGLQYTSSFIGVDEMEWYTSGCLLLLNTFGLSMLCWLSLLLVVVVSECGVREGSSVLGLGGEACEAREGASHGTVDAGQGRVKTDASDAAASTGKIWRPTALRESGKEREAICAAGNLCWKGTGSEQLCAFGLAIDGMNGEVGQAEQLLGALLFSNSMRFAGLCVCLLSAAVQQQHILLWAIFAPKLVFEVLLMGLADACHVFVAAIWVFC